MIRRLRGRHRWWIPVGALVCAVGLPAALLVRSEVPTMDDLSSVIEAASRSPRPASAEALREIGTWPSLWTGEAEVSTRLLRDEAGLAVLELTALRLPDAPDLLVYWHPSHTGVGTSSEIRLPDDARLLGAIGPARAAGSPVAEGGGEARRRFFLGAPDPAGGLYLYSLGHGRIVAAATLPTAETGEG